MSANAKIMGHGDAKERKEIKKEYGI